MGLITGTDLLEAGWPKGPKFKDLLDSAKALEARGITDPAYIIKLLERDFEKEDLILQMREKPLSFSEAIEATSALEEKNLSAVRKLMGELMRCPVVEKGALMPDSCPAGSAEATIPVGGAIETRNAILPSAHSADVCCSMYASIFECNESTQSMMDNLVDSTRFGYGGRREDDRVDHPVLSEPVWSNRYLQGLEEYAAKHIADQGDGNHFAYLGKIRVTRTLVGALTDAGHEETARALRNRAGSRIDDDGGVEFFTLVTHHGSRGLGAQLYKRGHKAAIKETSRIAKGIPKAAAWLDVTTDEGADYWEALQYVSRWTKANHTAIHERFLARAEGKLVTEFGNEHNFVWRKENPDGSSAFLHGKGATPAWKNESEIPLLGLIPLNMAEPILLTLGSDNSDFLSFAPHGAGRNQSRTATLRQFRKEKGDSDDATIAKAIEAATKGLDIRWYYGKGDLTESPLAYKSASQIRAQIEQFELAEIIGEVTPLGSIMAGDSGPKPWMNKDLLTPKQERQIEHRADRRKQKQSFSQWEEGESNDL